MRKYKKIIWFKLDNAAKLYPSVLSSRNSTLFRISADLHKPVNVSILQKSAEKVLERLEYYKVSLEKGFFWYYFEHNSTPFRLQPDSKYPCGYMPYRNISRYPFRIRVYANRIAIEISHALTDGTGALSFLKILLYQYLRDSGESLPYPDDVPDIHIPAADWEYEDSFRKYYSPRIPKPAFQQPAFHLPDRLISRRKYIITSAELPCDSIVRQSRKYNISVTAYLLSVYFQSILTFISDKGLSVKRPVRIMLPVNLRNIFPSRTMLNFFLTVVPEIDPRLGQFSFEEICKQIHHYMAKEINPKLLLQQLSRNVGLEQTFFIRSIPLVMKDLLLPLIYRYAGQNLSTSSLSNLGIVNLPDQYKEFVKRLDFIPAPSKIHKISAGVLSYNGKMYINFGRLIRSSSLERLFFTYLERDDIPVRIISNEVS